MEKKQINSILIANRGEIASRIIRTCRKLGIRSIVLYSEADRKAPFVREADTAIFLGPSEPAASYLNQDKIIQAAAQTGANAIHPGYGFLSENAQFARVCAEKGLIFVGPNPAAIEAMGDKARAKSLMQKHIVPVVPGYQGEDQSEAKLAAVCEEIGFPVLLKATAGGGGKGMRIVRSAAEFSSAYAAAKREAQNAFGDDQLIIEKYIESGRHIEFQIFGDQQGNTLHLMERECSIQRRYQKVIEESPSPIMDQALRDRMGSAAVQAAKALSYDNAGTVEFIYDQKSGDFYFLEVNTRLQVEHPVTEMITGLDLVEWQILAAMGEPLPLQQSDIKTDGYAVECRLYAEDPANDFLPVTGTLERFSYPQIDGLRVDAAVESGSEISVYYDPMIAKLIVWGENRTVAHRKMRYLLSQLQCLGTTTNQSFLQRLFAEEAFQRGDYDTHFLAEHPDLARFAERSIEEQALFGIAASLYLWQSRESQRSLLRSLPSGWRNSFSEPQRQSFELGEESIQLAYRSQNGAFDFFENGRVQLLEANQEMVAFEMNGQRYQFAVLAQGNQLSLQHQQVGMAVLQAQPRFPEPQSEANAGGYVAPMPSQVVKILVETGQSVEAGEPLLVLSSMKMENTINASSAGVVEEIYAQEGHNIEAGFVLLSIIESES
ncbi:MAG: acetyl-CoA carboxylase biotin carboxylase subunit [Bacteroidota bacterium]